MKQAIYLFILLITCTGCAQKQLHVLIVDGQNNHAVWPKSTLMMKQYLEETGLFKVAIQRTKNVSVILVGGQLLGARLLKKLLNRI